MTPREREQARVAAIRAAYPGEAHRVLRIRLIVSGATVEQHRRESRD